ncbi:hypothetical protein WS97_00420 [Burkholderia territorii]|nr:hypothetical protein WS97_00420 [Burkholderia territorii]
MLLPKFAHCALERVIGFRRRLKQGDKAFRLFRCKADRSECLFLRKYILRSLEGRLHNELVNGTARELCC